MPKTSTTKRVPKQTAVSSSPDASPEQSWKRRINWRPIILLGLVAIVGLISVIVNHVKDNKQLTARQTADAFMQAVTDCDADAVARYSPILGADQQKMATFRQQCKPGVITTTFAKDDSAQVGASAKSKSNGEAVFTYKVHDESQKTYKDSTMVVQVVRSANKQSWEVLLANGVPTL